MVKSHLDGGNVNAIEFKEFKESIAKARLIDLLLIGRKYTWHYSNGTMMSKLDRYLVVEEWLQNWKSIKQRA